MVAADGTAAPSGTVHDRQARRAVLEQCLTCAFYRLIDPAARGRRPHDLVDANVRRLAVIGRHPAAHVSFGDHAYELQVLCVLNHGRTAATR